MAKKVRTIYPKEIEAAWYVINKFISNFDYVIRYTDENGKKQIATVNPNCVVAAKISKIDIFKPISISKSMLQDHFSRDVIIFYKSSPNAKLTTGYGRSDKEALALPFSTDLDITTKKTTDPKYLVLLIGIDIDCHNGEKHVKEVEELIKKYLPHTYWEDSTNGKGRHGYLKIKFINSFGIIETITNYLKQIFSELNTLKNLLGYEAKIDDPAGLPYKIEFSDTNPYHNNWTTLYGDKFLGRYINYKSKIWRSYISYLKSNTTHYISTGKLDPTTNPNKLLKSLSEEQIKTTFSAFLYENNINFVPPTKNNKFYKITYQRAFKLPMLGSTIDFNTPTIDCIKRFHTTPHYTSSELKTAYNQIKTDINKFPSVSVDINKNTDFVFFQINNKNIALKEEQRVIGNNCACTNTLKNTYFYKLETSKIEEKQILAETIEWSNINSVNKEELNINVFWENYRRNKNTKNSNKYEDIINKLKNEKDTMKKTALFITAYINKFNEIPTVDEAEKEYLKIGLNSNNQSTVNRRNRFKGCIDYFSGQYNKDKNGFSLCWQKGKTGVLGILKPYFQENLTYKQGQRVRNINIEEVGFVYQIIKKMGELDQDCIIANSLSYDRADKLFEQEFGRKCGRHKFASIIKMLLNQKLIIKVGNYKTGLRGNCYSRQSDREMLAG